VKKTFVIALSLLLCLSLLVGCGGSGKVGDDGDSAAKETQLNLFTWEGMFPQEVLDEFTAETGITINYSNFDFNETMLAKLQTAKGGDYDLVIADDYILETVISEGLAQKLDKSKLKNFGNINPIYQAQFYDPNDEYTVPYGAGVQTIVYDPEVVKMDIKGYADFWDSSLKNSIGIIANYRVINGMALKVLGESYNTEDIATIEAAGEKLLELAPNIRLIKDDNLQDDLLTGEVGVAVMYTSQVTMAKLSKPELRMVFPSEGIGFGIMAQFIPSNAPHPDAAHKFIDYILQPEVSARCFEWMGFYCTNKAAEEYITEEYKEFLTLPTNFTGDMEMIQRISPEAEEVHTKIWTKFKSETGN